MPRRDMTGPRGEGASTGRGFGPCEPGEERVVGNLRYGMGRRFQKACGRGVGLGLSRNLYSGSNSEDILSEEKRILESRLIEVNEMLNKKG